MKKYKLTPEHKQELKTYKDKWIKNALSTKPMNDKEKQICKENVINMYKSNNLVPPKNIVFVSSPFILRFASGLAIALLKRKVSNNFTNNATNTAIYDINYDITYDGTYTATRTATYAAISNITHKAVNDATHNAINDATYDATYSVTNAATYAATYDAVLNTPLNATNDITHTATRTATYAAISNITRTTTSFLERSINDTAHTAPYIANNDATHVATIDATYSATHTPTHAVILDATYVKTHDTTRIATYDPTLDATYAATYAATNDTTFPTPQFVTNNNNLNTSNLKNCYVINNCLKELDKEFNLNKDGITEANSVYNRWQGGNQLSGWCSYISFFKDIVKLNKTHNVDYTNYNYWEQLCLHSGPRVVHENFCMISDRPELLLLDSDNRPHSLTGPFCKWRDGSALYAVHGTNVPAWIIERKQDITPALIDKEENIEVRRAMLQIYGEEKYLIKGNYEVLDIDKDQFGRKRRLLRSKAPSNGSDTGKIDEDIVKVEVINSTQEPDRTYNIYYLSVDPELRPLLKDADEKSLNMTRQELINKLYLGKPQNMSCHNAVASTFGKYGEEYGKNGQIRQGDVFIEFKDGTNQRKFRES